MASPVKVYGPPLSTAVSRVLACLLEKDVHFQLVSVNMAKGEHKTPDYLKIQVWIFAIIVYLFLPIPSPFLFCSVLFALLLLQCNSSSPLDKYQHFKMSTSLSSVIILIFKYIAYYYTSLVALIWVSTYCTVKPESRAISRYICEKYADQGCKGLYGTNPLVKASIEQWIEAESQTFNPPSSALVFQLAFAVRMNLQQDEKVIKQNEEKLGKVLDVYEKRLGESKYLAGDEFTLADLSHLPNIQYLVSVTDKGELFTSRENVGRWWSEISSRESWKKVVEMQSLPPPPQSSWVLWLFIFTKHGRESYCLYHLLVKVAFYSCRLQLSLMKPTLYLNILTA